MRSVHMLLALGLAGCGAPEEQIMAEEGKEPFGGRKIEFRSQYVHFPSSFAVTIVRDTMPQEEVCPILARYGNPPLPYKEEHYSLLISIQAAAAGDDVTIDIDDRGPAGDMRSVGLGLFPVGARAVPAGGFGVDAGGTVRMRELVQGQRAAGSYSLKFRTGETLSGDFDVTACP